MINWLLGLLIYPLIFGSGAASLTLILLWMHRFAGVYGDGMAMLLAVPAAILTGLIIGAWGLGSLSERLNRPIFIYAFGSLAVSGFTFLMPAFMPAIAQMNTWAGQSFGGDSFKLGLVRFLMTFALTFVPVALIGANLPVVASAVITDPRHYGLKAGGFYSAFTLGGGCAIAFASLFLLPCLGLNLSEMCSGGLNLLIGLVALAAAIRLKRPFVPERLPAWLGLRKRGVNPDYTDWALRAVFVSGLIGMASFVMWNRGLSLVLSPLGNTAYAEGALLTFVLIGISIGCGLISILVFHQSSYLRLFGLVLTLLGMSIAVSVLMLHFGSDLFVIQASVLPGDGDLVWPMAILNLSSQTLGIIGMPAMLTGMASTLAICLTLDQRRMGQSAGRLLGIYILGGLVGGFLGQGFLLVKFGLSLSLLGLGAAQVIIGLAMLHKAANSQKHMALMTPVALLLLAAVALSLPGKNNRGLYSSSTPLGRELFYEEDAQETIGVLQDRRGYKTLYRQGAPVTSTRPEDIVYQKLLVHLPMLFRDQTSRVLLVDFGNGATPYSILHHDRVKEVDVTARSLGVFKASAFQTEANHSFLRRPDARMRSILGDLQDYLGQTEATYDLVTLDFTDLRQQAQASQFATQYFEDCRKVLSENGMLAAWLPLDGLDADLTKTALATFVDVFPESAVFYITTEPTRRLLLIGQMQPWSIDYQRCERNLAESDVRDDLAEYFLDDLDKLLSFYLISGPALNDFVEGSVINDVEHPRLAFLAPINIIQDPLDSLDAILKNSEPVEKLIRPNTVPARNLQRIERFEEARTWLIQGHRQILQDKYEEATESYLKALSISPDDLSLRQNLLAFPMLQQWIQTDPEDPLPCILLGRAFMLQPDKAHAALELLELAETRIKKAQKIGEQPEDHWQAQLTDIRKRIHELSIRLENEDAGRP